MISNEASASELAISNAITRPPSREAPPNETRSSGARPACAPAPAKVPPRYNGAAALRSDRRHGADHTFFSGLPGGSGFKPHFSTHVYHILLSPANANRRLARSGYDEAYFGPAWDARRRTFAAASRSAVEQDRRKSSGGGRGAAGRRGRRPHRQQSSDARAEYRCTARSNAWSCRRDNGRPRGGRSLHGSLPFAGDNSEGKSRTLGRISAVSRPILWQGRWGIPQGRFAGICDHHGRTATANDRGLHTWNANQDAIATCPGSHHGRKIHGRPLLRHEGYW